MQIIAIALAAAIAHPKRLEIEQIVMLTGKITMPIGVLGHEGSTVLVTFNGLRLLRI